MNCLKLDILRHTFHIYCPPNRNKVQNDSVAPCGRFVGRAPDIDEGDGRVEPIEDDEGHRGVAQEGPQ